MSEVIEGTSGLAAGNTTASLSGVSTIETQSQAGLSTDLTSPTAQTELPQEQTQILQPTALTVGQVTHPHTELPAVPVLQPTAVGQTVILSDEEARRYFEGLDESEPIEDEELDEPVTRAEFNVLLERIALFNKRSSQKI